MLNEDDGTSGGTGDVSRDPGADRAADAIRIDGKIGTDPEELRRWADHVVAGKPIEHMEIADLRSLIEAVQAHPEARLWPRREDDETRLEITGGVVQSGVCQALDVRVTLIANASFAGGASFEGASFAGEASFANASFSGVASFYGASFAGVASFEGASFAREASFANASFAGMAWFGGASFAERAWFDRASFAWEASFRGANFAAEASFGGASFAKRAWFGGASFAGVASFEGASFAGGACFDGASFAGRASFDRASFSGVASFGGATFDGEVSGDLRTSDMSRARAAMIETGRRHTPWIMIDGWQSSRDALTSLLVKRRERPWDEHSEVPGIVRRVAGATASPFVILWELWPTHRENRAFRRVLMEVVRAWLSHGPVDWGFVRSLGRLSILNRVSLVAIVAVPILAAVYVAAQKIVAESEGGTSTVWLQWAARAIGDSPHLSRTLALAFFASVLVTIGLLIYQTFAPDAIKSRDEDEHVRDVEARYADDNASLRGDGLRRSIERLEDQAKVRPNRHPSFVKHHGDTIWIPPRDRPEWFRDDDLKDEEFWKQQREIIRSKLSQDGLYDDDESVEEVLRSRKLTPPMRRPGFVPAAERARICIEEGARAEYWLKAHEKIGWAWVSLVCYLLGIAILLVILFIQCRSVAKAAWWPENTTVRGIG